MSLWFVFALMTVAAVFAVLWPLGRRYQSQADGTEATVYRDQLAEVDRDLAGGSIGVAEAEAARIEISRRLLAATDAEAAPLHGRAACIAARGRDRRTGRASAHVTRALSAARLAATR